MGYPPAIESLASILITCRQKRNLPYAMRLLAYLHLHELESHEVLGNYLVPMLADCGSLTLAQQVFDKLLHRNEHSWNALISAYIDHGRPRCAFCLYSDMLADGVLPNSYIYVVLLKACAGLPDVETGQRVHAETTKMGLERGLFVGCSLIDVYGKCGSFADAHYTLQSLPVRDAASWTALIAGYAEHGIGKEALLCFKQMQLEGIFPDTSTLVCSLKACAIAGALEAGRDLHAEITGSGLEKHLYVGSAIVDMYAKCGALVEARIVLGQMMGGSTVAWTAMITGYIDHGCGEEALNCFEQMHLERIFKDASTYICTLKACSIIRASGKGQNIHDQIVKLGLERESTVGHTLLDMYANCKLLPEAEEVFHRLSVKDAVAWNALIAGYAEHGLSVEALRCYQQMQLEGVSPVSVTLNCVLKACGAVEALGTGRSVHIDVTLRGLERDLYVSTSLLDMYAKCGLLAEAQQSFDKMPVRSLVTWTALIAGYAENGLGNEALHWFEEMQVGGMCGDVSTFVCILKACGIRGSLETAQEIHCKVTKQGFEREFEVGNTLVDMYAKCGSLMEAQWMFDQARCRTVVAWTALIAGYTENGLGEEALELVQKVQVECATPDVNMLVCSLKVCGIVGALETGQAIHADVVRRGLERETYLGHALVDMYARCGTYSFLEAQETFHRLPVRDAVSWNALITGYIEHGFGEEALNCYQHMQPEGVSPVAVTYICSLKACGLLRALDTGCEIHSESTKRGLETDTFVGNTLVDMYCKCGLLSEGRSVFEKLPVRDVVSWNAIIKGYGENHQSNMAVQLFEDMQRQGVKPDSTTFTCLLVACTHASLVLKGQDYFKLMMVKYRIGATLDHCTCIVDLLVRSGQILAAEKFAEAMQCLSSKGILRALLAGCKLYGEVELGLKYFQQLVQMNQDDATIYLLMADIYTSAERWSDANGIEAIRRRGEATKKPACAAITVNRKFHEFCVGDDQGRDVSRFVELLNSHVKYEGYVPNLVLSFRHFDENTQ